PPLEIEGGPLRAIDYSVKTNSAQVASCVLLAGLFAQGTTTVRIGYARTHTQNMLPTFGVDVDLHERETGPPHIFAISVTGPTSPRGASLRVPRDFSGAAFFLAAPAATPPAAGPARR